MKIMAYSVVHSTLVFITLLKHGMKKEKKQEQNKQTNTAFELNLSSYQVWFSDLETGFYASPYAQEIFYVSFSFNGVFYNGKSILLVYFNFGVLAFDLNSLDDCVSALPIISFCFLL